MSQPKKQTLNRTNEIVKRIEMFNATIIQNENKIRINTNVIFNIGCILARIEYIEQSTHSKNEVKKYENDVSKISAIAPDVDKIVFSTAKGESVEVSSNLLIDIIIWIFSSLTSKKSKGGRPENESIEMSLEQIEALKREGVQIEFIAGLFSYDADKIDSFKRLLLLKQKIPSRK